MKTQHSFSHKALAILLAMIMCLSVVFSLSYTAFATPSDQPEAEIVTDIPDAEDQTVRVEESAADNETVSEEPEYVEEVFYDDATDAKDIELTEDNIEALAEAGKLTVDMVLEKSEEIEAEQRKKSGNRAPAVVGEILVNYKNESGEVIDAVDAPTHISKGWFNGTDPESNYPKKILASDGKKYRFVEAMVEDQKCLFIDTIFDFNFFSTDGQTAIILPEDKTVDLIYHQYYTVNLIEHLTAASDSLTAGTADVSALIASSGDLFNLENGDELDVDVGDYIHVTIEMNDNGQSGANQKRFFLQNVHTSDPYHETAVPSDGHYSVSYDWEINRDTVVNLYYTDQGKYHINMPIVSSDYDTENIGNNGYVEYTSGVSSYQWKVNTYDQMWPLDMELFGVELELTETYNGAVHATELVDSKGNAIRFEFSATRRIRLGANYYYLVFKLIDLSGKGLQDDYDFITQWTSQAFTRHTLQLYADGRRSNDGVTCYFWTGDTLQVARDGDKQNANAAFGERAVLPYFLKAKPGYRITHLEGRQSSGINIINASFTRLYGSGFTYAGSHVSLKSDTIYGVENSLPVGEAGRVGWQNRNVGAGRDAAIADGCTIGLIRIGQGITSAIEQYRTEVYAVSIKYHLRYSSNIPVDANGNAPRLPATSSGVSIGHSITVANRAPTAAGYVFTGYKLVKDTSNMSKRYQPGDHFPVSEETYMLTDNHETNTNGTEDEYFTLQAQFVPAAEIYLIKHIVDSPFTDGHHGSNFNDATGTVVYTPVEVKTEENSIVGGEVSQLEAFGVPLTYSSDEEDLELIRGYEVDWDKTGDSWKMALGEMDIIPEHNVLAIYYKVATVTVNYEADGPGTITEPTTESRLYFSKDEFAGCTASPKWNAEFLGWYNKETDELVTTDAKLIPDKFTSATYVAKFNKTIETGSLSISKEISGNMADTSKKFDFEIQAVRPAGSTVELPAEGFECKLNGESISSLVFSQDRKATFELGHNDSLEILDIPVGWNYIITETPAQFYTTSYRIGDGELVEGNVATVSALTTDGAEIAFVNHRDTPPITGLNDNISLYVCLIFFMVVTSLFFTMIGYRTKKRHKG